MSPYLEPTTRRLPALLGVLLAASLGTVLPASALAQQQATAELEYRLTHAGTAPAGTLSVPGCNGSFSFNASAFGQNPGAAYLPPTGPGSTYTGSCNLRNTSGTSLLSGGRASVYSYAQKPAVFEPSNPTGYRLARLGARASLTSELRQWDAVTGRAPDGEPASALWTASATASFTDYLRVVDPNDPNVRVRRLLLELELSGALSIGPFPGGGGNASASGGFSVFAGNDVDGTFASFESSRSLSGPDLTVPGGTEQSFTPTPVGPIRDAGPCTIGSGPGCVRLEITPAFFLAKDANGMPRLDMLGNPIPLDITTMQLTLAIVASATSQDIVYLNLFGNTITERVTSADFSNTLRMVGLQALDANDADVTSVLRFSSLPTVDQPGDGDGDGGGSVPPVTPVPEPASGLLLMVGLGGWLLRSRRTAV